MIRFCIALALFVLAPVDMMAQVSVYAVHGIGFPGRPVSVRTRALGGGSGAFDPTSALNPASVSGFTRVTAMASSGTEFRTYDVGGVASENLRSTRFPLALIGGRVAGPFAFAFSAGTYAERTFDLTTSDTIMLRGAPVAVDDRLVSDGGIVDVRGAIAWTLRPTFHIGVAGHLLSGSTKLRISRDFGDSTYRSFRQEGDASFSGRSVSAGVIWAVLPGLQVAGAFRYDTRLKTTLDSVPSGEFDLPLTFTAGIRAAPHPAIRVSLTGQRRTWSDAAADVAASGALAFDTYEVGAGVEIGGTEVGTSSLPLRFGFRYAQLPFAPDAEQPRELVFAAGTGILFASGRGLLDVALERIQRDGTGVRERGWQFSLGMTVRP